MQIFKLSELKNGYNGKPTKYIIQGDSYFQITDIVSTDLKGANQPASFVILPRCFLDAVQSTPRCQFTETDTRHSKESINCTRATRVNAPVSYSSKSTVPRQFGQFVATFLSNFVRKIWISTEGFEELSFDFEFLRHEPPIVIFHHSLLLRQYTEIPRHLFAK